MNQQNQDKEFFFSPQAEEKNAAYFRKRARDFIKPHFWMLVLLALLASLLAGTAGGVTIGDMPSVEISEESVPILETAVTGIIVLIGNGEIGAIFAQYPFVSTLLWLALTVLGVSFLYSLFVGSAVELGHRRIYLGLIDGETPETKGLFGYFKKCYGKAVLARLFMTLIRFAVSLPMLVGMGFFLSMVFSLTYHSLMGNAAMEASAVTMLFISLGVFWAASVATSILAVVIDLRYAFVTLILAEYPELGVVDAFRNSAALMKGNKWRLFCLQFSFIGWNIVARLIPYGLGVYILMPYKMAADTAFYHEIARRDVAEETEFPSLDPNDYDPNAAQW